MLVRGGNGLRDESAHLVADAAGPGPPPKGRSHEERAAHGAQTATLAALAIIKEQTQGNCPILLRVDTRYTTCIAGMHPVSSSELGDKVRKVWRATKAERVIYLAGYKRGSRAWWGDRAECLAPQCGEATWGTQPLGWPTAPLATLKGSHPDGTHHECPSCLETFSDLLPRPDPPSGATQPLTHTRPLPCDCPQNASHTTCM